MTDFTELVKLLTAMVSLLTALIGLSEALKQRTKQKAAKRTRSHIAREGNTGSIVQAPPINRSALRKNQLNPNGNYH